MYTTIHPSYMRIKRNNPVPCHYLYLPTITNGAVKVLFWSDYTRSTFLGVSDTPCPKIPRYIIKITMYSVYKYESYLHLLLTP